MYRVNVCWLSKIRRIIVNINDVKNKIEMRINSRVKITVYGMRNRVNEYVGNISGTYPYIFTVLIDNENKSFSYADVITKEVDIKYL